MMQSAEDRLADNESEPLDRPKARRVLVQRQTRPAFVIVAGVGRKDLAQMGLAKYDDMIEAFPTDRADQSQHWSAAPIC
jgi:hypothetical protein